MPEQERRGGAAADDVVDGEAALWALGLPEAAPCPPTTRMIAEVASLREAIALLVLGLDAVTPDAQVWMRVDAALAPCDGSGARAVPPRAAARRSYLGPAAVAVSLAAAAALTVAWRSARRDRDAVQAALHERLLPLRSPDLTLTTFRGETAGVARILASGDRRWLVIALDLPQVPAHDYQLWLIPEGGEPISAGLLRRDRDGSLDGTAVVPPTMGRVRPAISLEPAGGSTSPTIVAMVGAPL